ncbi:TIM-barrel domain-containing protein [Clostridium sp. 'White wine YQ']|uniref:TIM-barrel domain-containing protein n=1 Tax=Clostridium sp. 'White wine YQ' TaxID=3027474 RepID=UPI002366A450|nr:TIM-barrel domain-containing protein [Clostridium sp. 'White wine YQ']MDD7793467.1 glycoside hydrolase family 31 protein [Clostridium sp. 'White wine YQ']
MKVPQGATSLTGIDITKPDGTKIWTYTSLPSEKVWLPTISEKTMAWAIADNPRMVPAEWGYNLAPTETVNNGWDLNNNAPDMYVFLPNGDGKQLRKDFLDLTGHTDMVPLSALGYWDSRWYKYTEDSALKQIDDYRAHDIPLDNLVIDTDWRVNGSTGYDIATDCFPDMTKFLSEAHDKNVSVMFNDHPEPVAGALDTKEVTFRNNGLRSLLDKGLDTWWYDRNWSVALTPPTGLVKETWGMYMYNGITADVNKNKRSMIMANVDGIDNGYRNTAPSIASHRYPIQWTGDIQPDFASLQREVDNAVYSGMYAAYPYISADLGGHTSNPTPEGYIRWLQYGALSPITRPHCTLNLTRMPWTFGETAENITRDFVKMRYRLLPLFYSLARESYDTGMPMLRRCDFYYPGYKEASSNTQYLLGDGILVAPVLDETSGYNVVPSDWLKTSDGSMGLKGEYYANSDLSGSPVLTRTDSSVNFNWGTNSPASGVPADNFSARWTGNITVGDQDAILATTIDDGVRMYIDDKLVIDAWGPHDSSTLDANVSLAKGTTHSIKIEYNEGSRNALISLKWRAATPSMNATRTLWIPEGNWIDAWSGNIITGPQTITANVPIDKMPMYIKAGTMVPLAPEMSYTGEKPWDPVTLDLYPSVVNEAKGQLYEDDTKSNDYKDGAFRTTEMNAKVDNATKKITVNIDPAQGTFNGAISERSWVVRLHKTAEWKNPIPKSVTVDGVNTEFSIKTKDENAMPFVNNGGSRDGDIVEVVVPKAAVSDKRVIEVTYSVEANNADKSSLVSVLSEADKILQSASEEDYTKDSWEALMNTRNTAISVNNSADPSQIEVDAATKALKTAIDKLTLVNPKIEVNDFKGKLFKEAVNLTEEGKIAWAQYGLGSATGFNHKNGNDQISELKVIGNAGLEQVLDSRITMSWNDGAPVKKADGVINSSFIRNPGNASEFTVDLTSHETQRLKVYTTTWKAKGKLEVFKEDENGLKIPIEYVNKDGVTQPAVAYYDSPAGNEYNMWTLDLNPDSSKVGKQRLYIRYTTDSTYVYGGNTSIQGATLAAVDPTQKDYITGHGEAFTGKVNLSQEGTTSWAHYGLNDANSYNYKSGAQLIGDLISSAGKNRLGDSQINMSWNDGAPVQSADNATQAVYVWGANKGSEIKVKVDKPSRLKVYTTTWRNDGKFEVISEDGKSKPVIEYFSSPNGNGYTCWTVDFIPGSGFKAQTVTVRYTNDMEGGNTSIQGATLSPLKNLLEKIQPVPDIEIESGTSMEEALLTLSKTTTITDNWGQVYEVPLNWSIEDFDSSKAGQLTATGTFTLPEDVEQPDTPIDLKVTSKVTVKYVPPLDKITLTADKFILKPGDTAKLSVSGVLTDGSQTDLSHSTIIYRSDNKLIASVDNNGVVSGIGEGKTNITVSVTLRGVTKTDTISVMVDKTPPAYNFTLNGEVINKTAVFDDNLPLTFSIWDNLSGIDSAQLVIGDKTYTIDPKTQTKLTLDFIGKPGSYTAVITAKDNAGNTLEDNFSFRVTTSITSMRSLICNYIKTDELCGPIIVQLNNSLNQAQHQLDKGRKDNAIKQMQDFKKHLNNDVWAINVGKNAKTVLNADADAIIKIWSGKSE